MTFRRILMATAITLVLSSPAFAQGVTSTTQVDTSATKNIVGGVKVETQRDENQQDRIEQGLSTGDLNAREAERLEKGETRIDAAEARAMKNGKVSASEKARIDAMQDRESKAIYNQKHDAQQGNPDSKTSEALQKDVARDANQEKRINEGLDNGSLTKKEASRLEAGQARSDRMDSRLEKGGLTKKESARIQHRDNVTSKHIYRQKHDKQIQGKN